MMACETKNIIKGLADIVFPPGCILCGAFMDEHSHPSFCPHCFSQIHFIQSSQCKRCGVPFLDREGEDHLCGECITSEQFFSVARSLGKYDGVLLEAIHLFKYRGKLTVGKALGRLMKEHEYRNVTIRDYSLVIPVPLHKRRLKERGFNQSLILARELSLYFSIPLDFSLLKRTIHRKPQTMLKKKERLANVKGAFEVKSAEKIKGKKILLVDDVYTTGSTVKECSRMLLRHEAAEVAVLTLARTG
jgi:ComF family protein